MIDRQPPPKPPADATSAGQDDSRRVAKKTRHPRRVGSRGALSRAVQLREAEGRQEAVRKVAGRLQAVLENMTAKAMAEGELTTQGEVKQLVAKTIPDYTTLFMTTVRYLDGADAGDDPLAALLQGGRR